MDIKTAAAAGRLAVQIERLQTLIADIDLAIKEGWPLIVSRVRAPDDSSKKPGTELDLLPAGQASEENSRLALTTARDTYQAVLDGLTAQLDAL